MVSDQIQIRIRDFCLLGEWLCDEGVQMSLADKAYLQNQWFTVENTRRALDSITTWLTEDQLNAWLEPYQLSDHSVKTIGVIMAGNIPLAGFHDFLSVLITGNRIKIKMSSQDQVLVKAIAEYLVSINSTWAEKIELAEQIKLVDGVIATGSNNTSRYFEFYFRSVPLLLRHNRSSIAVLTGNETEDELSGLASDILSFFGLGCRNVSMLLIPESMSPEVVTKNLFSWRFVLDHHKYANNYTYQRALLLMDQQPFTDTGFCILRESDQLASPVGVIHYRPYKTLEDAHDWIRSHREEIQCVVSNSFPGSVTFGSAQRPELTDYADHIDTIRFITEKVSG